MAMVKGAGATLASWNDTPATRAIVEFVERVTQEGGADYVPPAERIAVFDNDGTLWCEKPIQIEVGFILKRLAEMADLDDSLRDRQPCHFAVVKKDASFIRGAQMHNRFCQLRLPVAIDTGDADDFPGMHVERHPTDFFLSHVIAHVEPFYTQDRLAAFDRDFHRAQVHFTAYHKARQLLLRCFSLVDSGHDLAVAHDQNGVT